MVGYILNAMALKVATSALVMLRKMLYCARTSLIRHIQSGDSGYRIRSRAAVIGVDWEYDKRKETRRQAAKATFMRT